jgi:hypothetical protein
VGTYGDSIIYRRSLQLVEAGTGFEIERETLRVYNTQSTPLRRPHDTPAEAVEQASEFIAGGSARAVEDSPLAAKGVGAV